MPTVTTLSSAARGAGARGRQPYMVQHEIDIAAAVTAKGSALAAGDIIEAISVPAETMIMAAGIEIMTAATATAATVHLGVTGGDVDNWAVDFDITGAAGTYSTVPEGDANPVMVTSADTLDVELNTVDTLTAGKIRVWALMLNVSDMGSMGADEVDRDTLA